MSARKENVPLGRPGSSSSSRSRIPVRSKPASLGLDSSSSHPVLRTLGDITNRPSAAQPKSSSSQTCPSGPLAVPPAIREWLENIDSTQLRDGKILAQFLKTAGIEDDENESCQILNLGSGDGRLSFLLHKLLPNTLIQGLEDRLDLLALARAERNDILNEEGKWFPDHEDEKEQSECDYGIEVAEADQQLIGFLRFEILRESPFRVRYDPAPKKVSHLGVSTKVGPPLMGVEHSATAVVCSLFLDNVPLPKFFAVVTALLGLSRGYLLITNIHPTARRLPGFGQALVAEASHYKPHFHTIKAIIDEASKQNFSLIKQDEKQVTIEDAKKLGSMANTWVGARCWFSLTFEHKDE